jgi:glycosyltransferase involved in cell wall biosynthesis
VAGRAERIEGGAGRARRPRARWAVREELSLTLVVPARDEEANVAALVHEVDASLRARGIAVELVVVDDGSRDGTVERLAALAASRPWLRPLRLGAAAGKSAALRAGIREARAPLVATMDADLQDDPADLLPMLDLLLRGEAGFVQGCRVRRADGAVRVASAAVGRIARRIVLGDHTVDTGCGLRAMETKVALSLPLDLEGMHRFLPHLARGLGARVVEVPVSHRPRRAGKSRYGLLGRGVSGLADLLAVRWMSKRRRSPEVFPVPGERE